MDDYIRFATLEPKDRRAILADPVGMFSDMMAPDRYHHAHLLLSRAQLADVEMTGALRHGGLDRIREALINSPRFTVIYRNSQAMVITLTQPAPDDGNAQPAPSQPRADVPQPISSVPGGSATPPLCAPGGGTIDPLSSAPGAAAPDLTVTGPCANLQVDITGLLSTPINFATGGSTMSDASQQVLNQIADKLRSCPDAKVAVTAYTDDTGGDAINIPLSAHRAQSVADYLVLHGVDGGRVTSAGLGSANPLADNGTLDGQARNRRVEIQVS
jgi:outer membrane protein OmpA-like peptidoglycan-associated protein